MEGKLDDQFSSPAIQLFCDWFNRLQTVNLWDLPNRLAEEVVFFRNEFMQRYKEEQG